jgi:hypothetical protein
VKGDKNLGGASVAHRREAGRFGAAQRWKANSGGRRWESWRLCIPAPSPARRGHARRVHGHWSRKGTTVVTGRRRRCRCTRGGGRRHDGAVPGTDMAHHFEKVFHTCLVLKIYFIGGSGDRDRLQTKSGHGGAAGPNPSAAGCYAVGLTSTMVTAAGG